jgi:hypothetical protein
MFKTLESIPLTGVAVIAVKGEIDSLICGWRAQAESAEDLESLMISQCYIDAYQTLRRRVYGRTLPKQKAAK